MTDKELHMNHYRISNNISGTDLGVYKGETPEEALDAMARDAGYADQAEAAEVAETKPGELSVIELSAPVRR